MDTSATKDLLHLRIEQADDKLLAVLAELTESLFRSYQPEAVEAELTEEEIEKLLPPTSMRKRMTKDESLAELRDAQDEFDRGEFLTSEELDKEMAAW